MTTALRLSGLAFDAYVEPDTNSSRWERGSSGLCVAFCSAAYTRQLYSAILEIQIQQCTNLPAEPPDQSTPERLLSGSGVDACLLTAIIEGTWKDDVATLETEQYHTGVLDLTGAAHVSRSSTCWASVTKEKAQASERKNKIPLPYHIPASSNLFGLLGSKGGTAIWPSTEPPLYLYVQDPATARLVLTVVDDDRLLSSGSAIGSTYRRVSDLIPMAGVADQSQLVQELKTKVITEMERTGVSLEDALERVTNQQQQDRLSWDGSLPLTSKPRKRDKNGQIWAAAAAGAAVAGPMGAAAGAVLGSFYEGSVQGDVQLRLRYRPIPSSEGSTILKRKTYTVLGGMPGITWGSMFDKYLAKRDGAESTTPLSSDAPSTEVQIPTNDLEHCFFVTHSKTGATCAVYRSLQEKIIVVSFRGTCAPIDLLTDASLIQEAWVQGDDIENQSVPKVHVGFRTSMDSIARRLKELILAVPAPGDSISDYEMWVTGHSLGASLATLFTADVGQFGIDAGRGLPQLEPSEPWWKSVANVFVANKGNGGDMPSKGPPRPKALRLYNFGSPRVGNVAFAELVDALRDEGMIDEIYRIVNGEDVVARLPRSVNALVLGNINYEHVGSTVLLTQPDKTFSTATSVPAVSTGSAGSSACVLWVEGESDDNKCPVRDGVSLNSPMAEGSLLGDLWAATQIDDKTSSSDPSQKSLTALTNRMSTVAGRVTERMKQVKASDIASLVGIDQRFTDREFRLIQSLLEGKALTHHLEDEYYAGMGLACGFQARVGEELVEV